MPEAIASGSLFAAPYRSSSDDTLYLYRKQPEGRLTASLAVAQKHKGVIRAMRTLSPQAIDDDLEQNVCDICSK